MNARRVALRIFSGKNIYNFGIAERLRTLRYPIFTEKSRSGKRQLQRWFPAETVALRGYPFRHRLRRCHLPKGTAFRIAAKLPSSQKASPSGELALRSKD